MATIENSTVGVDSINQNTNGSFSIDKESAVDLISTEESGPDIVHLDVPVDAEHSDIEEIIEVKKLGPAQKAKTKTARKSCTSKLPSSNIKNIALQQQVSNDSTASNSSLLVPQTISSREAMTSVNVADMEDILVSCGVSSPVMKYTKYKDLKKSLGIVGDDGDSDCKENQTPPPSLTPELSRLSPVKLPRDISPASSVVIVSESEQNNDGKRRRRSHALRAEKKINRSSKNRLRQRRKPEPNNGCSSSRFYASRIGLLAVFHVWSIVIYPQFD